MILARRTESQSIRENAAGVGVSAGVVHKTLNLSDSMTANTLHLGQG
ncbi:hypothetical protein [Streptomyces sp. ISL-11]|nr:hypothetical protein [Streptomyces sp. ISL-11]MBT2387333.1 hypothetical protein [Streptomyces sp. ISL-11]